MNGSKRDLVKIATQNRHFLLYSKNHYLISNIIDDLRKIQAHWTNTELQYIGIGHVYEHQVKLLRDLCGEQGLNNVLMDLWRWRAINTPLQVEDILKQINVELANIKVMERSDGFIFDLGEPDPTILPLNPEGRYAKTLQSK